uniref:Uncharacterized protein n=1 Tax=Arundo donax TaxID=35708 RepID=A0A0A9CJW7_ARUDO
MHPGTARPGT